ncbi:hypothetical protein [Kamptonema formosum]|uniref:hypothetical protein n=1 Tax=Kamptonema formosum TaxID=331992 RepID=UPI0012DCB0F5|nr:hypothetical protein [Oscillatoria sp. PCC 10802]
MTTAISLFCHFEGIRRICVISGNDRWGFHPSLTEEGYPPNPHLFPPSKGARGGGWGAAVLQRLGLPVAVSGVSA